jgi:hypothetical protein
MWLPRHEDDTDDRWAELIMVKRRVIILEQDVYMVPLSILFKIFHLILFWHNGAVKPCRMTEDSERRIDPFAPTHKIQLQHFFISWSRSTKLFVIYRSISECICSSHPLFQVGHNRCRRHIDQCIKRRCQYMNHACFNFKKKKNHACAMLCKGSKLLLSVFKYMTPLSFYSNFNH